MTARNSIGFGGAVLCLVGAVLLVATGAVADSLGALRASLGAGASDPSSVAFWFQLSFMRLFAVAIIGLGAILLWCRTHLTDLQQRSLARVLTVALGALALMAVGQQIAIWNASTGWVLAATLMLAAAACAPMAMRARRAAH